MPRYLTALMVGLAVILGVLTANLGQAQVKKRQSPRQDSQDAFIALVIRELKLTDDQAARFRATQKAAFAWWRELSKLPPKQREAQSRAFYRARQATLQTIFNDEQLTRFREILAELKKPAKADTPTATEQVTIHVDVSKELEKINKDLSGFHIGPTGHNAYWAPVLKPNRIFLGWGGDVWHKYNTWPAEGKYNWEILNAKIEGFLAAGREVTLSISLVPEWLWDPTYDDNDVPTSKTFPYLKKGHTRPPKTNRNRKLWDAETTTKI